MIRIALLTVLSLVTSATLEAAEPHERLAEQLQERLWSTLSFSHYSRANKQTDQESIEFHRTDPAGSIFLRKKNNRVIQHGIIPEERLLEIETAIKKLCSQLEPPHRQTKGTLRVVITGGVALVSLKVKVLNGSNDIHTGFVALGGAMTSAEKQLTDYFSKLTKDLSQIATSQKPPEPVTNNK